MLSKEAADQWRDKYLPRFYESKLGTKVGDAWDKAVAMMSSQPRVLKGIGGKSLKRRGMTEVIDAKDLKRYEAQGWKLDDPGFKPGVTQRAQVHRDFTREEREKMGEIRDAMFRFVMGYMRAQKDLALGRLYEHLSETMASRHELPGYVRVPETRIDGTDVNSYGKLAGMFVPNEVLAHLSQYGESEHEAVLKAYRKALGMWKEGKTVLNPVSHMNNVVSNLTMAHFAGVHYWDAHKYAATVKDFFTGGPMLKEARAAGLFGGTISESELMNMLPKEMRVMAQITKGKFSKGVEHVWNILSWGMRKPLGVAYQSEDLFFRHLIYREARARGLHQNDAVDYAQKYIFTYDDLPKGARLLRDSLIPFFSYTYKAVPVLAHTISNYPWRYAAPWALLHTVNMAMYAIAQSHDDDDKDTGWRHLIEKFVTDPAFRQRVVDKEALERKFLPPWMKGDGIAMHTPKTIRLGTDQLTQLPVFMDVSRFFPGGDLLDTNSNTGALPWLAEPDPVEPADQHPGGDDVQPRRLLRQGHRRQQRHQRRGGPQAHRLDVGPVRAGDRDQRLRLQPQHECDRPGHRQDRDLVARGLHRDRQGRPASAAGVRGDAEHRHQGAPDRPRHRGQDRRRPEEEDHQRHPARDARHPPAREQGRPVERTGRRQHRAQPGQDPEPAPGAGRERGREGRLRFPTQPKSITMVI